MNTRTAHYVNAQKGNGFRSCYFVVDVLKVLLLLLLIASCNKRKSQLYDSARIQRSDAVVRVVVEEEFGGSSYHFVRAYVISIFKNSTSSNIGEQIGIAYLGIGSGIPKNTPCTVYLKCVTQDGECRWKLDESDLNEEVLYTGFSHVGK